MLYTLAGVPLNEALPASRLQYAERAAHRKPQYFARNHSTGAPLYRVMKDKIGDPIRVYRGWHVHTPGAGFASRATDDRRHVVLSARRRHVQYKEPEGFIVVHGEAYAAIERRLVASEMVQEMTPLRVQTAPEPYVGYSHEPSIWHAVQQALADHGSQRKAAAAMGISLGKLQRTLKMVPAGA